MAGAPKGNNNAGVGASIRDAIRYEVAKLGREIEGDDVALVKGMRAIAAPHVKNAALGDMASFKEVADRLDGRPAASVTIAGDEEKPLITRLERVIIHGNAED